jgi:hypothetical protein
VIHTPKNILPALGRDFRRRRSGASSLVSSVPDHGRIAVLMFRRDLATVLPVGRSKHQRNGGERERPPGRFAVGAVSVVFGRAYHVRHLEA